MAFPIAPLLGGLLQLSSYDGVPSSVCYNIDGKYKVVETTEDAVYKAKVDLHGEICKLYMRVEYKALQTRGKDQFMAVRFMYDFTCRGGQMTMRPLEAHYYKTHTSQPYTAFNGAGKERIVGPGDRLFELACLGK